MRVFSKWLLALALTCGMVGLMATSAWAQKRSQKSVGWLGVTIQDVTSELSESLPRGVDDGALVNGVVDESPAALAGLKEGDVIVKFDQVRVRNSADLTDAVRQADPGHVAVIEFYRDGGRETVEAKLTEQKTSRVYGSRGEGRKRSSRNRTPHPGVFYWNDRALEGLEDLSYLTGDTPRLGVQLVDLTPQLSRKFGVESGVLVSEVVEGSAAETAGIEAGDVIVAVGGEPTANSRELRDELGKVDTGPVEITVNRDGKEETLTAELKRRRRTSMSGFHGPSAPMFNIPEVGFDSEALNEQMDQLRRDMERLHEEMAELKKLKDIQRDSRDDSK